MSVRLFAMNCGWQTGPLASFLEGLRGTIRVPTPTYLIDHPKGKVLFDSGLHTETQSSPQRRLGVIASVYEIDANPGDEVSAKLADADTDPSQISFLVNSHLHYDHCGGNVQIPDATLVVQRREWEAGHDDDLVASNYYNPADYDLGHDCLQVDGEHDLFGDGRVVCIPTYGHTPGHQALRVRTDGGEVILAGDSCYLRRTLDDMHLPGIIFDRGAMRETLARLRCLRDAGTWIFYGHDPEFWAGLAQAPHEAV